MSRPLDAPLPTPEEHYLAGITLLVDPTVPKDRIYILDGKHMAYWDAGMITLQKENHMTTLQKENHMTKKFLLGTVERIVFSLAQAYVALAVADVSYDRAFLVALGSSALLSLAKSIVSRGVGNPNDGSIIP